MKSKLYSINTHDVIMGLVVAVVSAVLTWFLQALNVPGFSVYTIDWAEIARIATTAGVAYIIKNFLSDTEGKVNLGSIKIG